MVPLVSIVIPYLNDAAYLREAVNSVFAQSEQCWELIVVDDASAEPARAALVDFDDARLTVVRNPQRLGIAGNWNQCLQHGTAPLVTLLHGDDRLRADYVREVLAAAARWPHACAIATGAGVIGADGRPTRTLADTVKRGPHSDHCLSGDAGLAAAIRRNYLYSPTLCYRRSSIGPAPFDPRWQMVLDFDLITRLLLRGDKIGVLAAVLYDYRRHPRSTSAELTRTARRFAEEIALHREIAPQGAAIGWSRTALAAHRRTTVRLHGLLVCLGQGIRGNIGQARRLAAVLVDDLRQPTGAEGSR